VIEEKRYLEIREDKIEGYVYFKELVDRTNQSLRALKIEEVSFGYVRKYC
jgi:hypothetical protein